MQQTASPANAAREYWDDVYRPGGCHEDRYRWAKTLERSNHFGEKIPSFLSGCSGKRILSIGGGIDHVALELARANNRVLSMDISPAATAATQRLAADAGLDGRLTAVTADANELAMYEEMDVVVAKRALHCLDASVVERARRALVARGVFLAEEPVCLSRVLRRLHASVPLDNSMPLSAQERELSPEDLKEVQRVFSSVQLWYAGIFGRDSTANLLHRGGFGGVLRVIGKIDLKIGAMLPPFRALCTYVVFRAVK